jgi:3-phosphoshikimate 1-carboxyvinyltransferase
MVEGDASSASYFLAAGALGGGPVRVQGVGRDSIQGDVRFTEVLERMGAKVFLSENQIEVSNPQKRLKALDMDLNHIPDAAMTAAVLALFADGPSTLRNIASWRVKETDRLAAMATELRKLGATVEEGKDFLKVVPGEIRPGVAIDTYDDHRMAMSFSLVSLGGVPVTINDPGCVAKTFPGYFDVFRSIAQGRTRDGPGSVPVIAIDGPSASGKGTIAKRVAQALGFHYLESGALYRLVALLALRHDLTDEAALARAVEHMDVVFQGDEILLEDQDVSQHIRHEAVGNRASEVARMPAVRQRLLTRQRAFRQPPGLVADGRDMATVVFPDAALKIFLTARPEIRAERRYKQLIEKGINANLRALSRDLAERDARDANRPVAPLVPAPDSQVLDSSALSVPAVVERILELCRERKLGGQGEHPA